VRNDGIIYALPLLALLRNPVQRAAEASSLVEARGVLRGLLGNRNFLLLVLYFTCRPSRAGWCAIGCRHLKEKFTLGRARRRERDSLCQIASLAGALIGGRWPTVGCTARRAPHLRQRHRHDALPAGAFQRGNAGTLAVAVAGLIIFGLGWGFFDCNNMPILCQIVRPNMRATGTAS